MAKGRKRAAFLIVICLVAVSAARARASELPSGFRDQIVLSGLEEPTTVRFAPNGLVFVAEKTGIIRVFDGIDDPVPTEFADLRTEVYDTFDRGLLGLALDPDFPARPYVYALYTYDHILGAPAGEVPKWGKVDASGDGCDDKPAGTGVDACPVSGRLVRLTADAASGYEEALTGGGKPEEKVLVEGWCAQFSSHSIGDLQFGPEGALYASGGEGSDANNVDYGKAGWPNKNQCGDPPSGVGGNQEPPSAEGGALRAQDARTPNPTGSGPDPTGLSGSVIRIDPDTGEGWEGNPLELSGDANERRLIAYGFRNPFRFSIDPAGGELYVGNVGWNKYEEIDRFEPSPSSPYNSGWPCYEGPAPNPNYASLGLTLCENLYAEPSATSAPFFSYNHSADVSSDDGECPRQEGSAISGNALYGGGAFPSEYEGALFFSDPVRGCIYVMRADGSGDPDPATVTTFLSGAGKYPGIDLEVGPEGALFYVSLFNENVPGDEFGAGAVHRVFYGPDTPFARLQASPQWGPASIADPLEVQLDAGESSDPNGGPLSYAWDLDGNGSFETTAGGAQQIASFTASKNVTVSVRVTDPSAKSDVARVRIYPGDTPPTPQIEAPTEALSWRVGQSIHFEGSAADGEDGGLGASHLFWKSRLFHCPQSASNCHVHPLQVFPGTDSGTFDAPEHDFPSRIELTLTAVDSRGLTASESIQLYPVEVDLQLATEPPGLTLVAGLLSSAAPFTLPAIEDAEVTLSAPQTQQLDGRTYTWQRWSDGGARVHSVRAEGAATYTAVYSTPALAPAAQTLPVAPPAAATTSAPQTKLGKHAPKRSFSSSARFEFSSDQTGSRFECKLDLAPYKPCRSPRVYRRLAPGQHALRVRALGPGGTDATPVLFRWLVLAPPD